MMVDVKFVKPDIRIASLGENMPARQILQHYSTEVRNVCVVKDFLDGLGIASLVRSGMNARYSLAMLGFVCLAREIVARSNPGATVYAARGRFGMKIPASDASWARIL